MLTHCSQCGASISTFLHMGIDCPKCGAVISPPDPLTDEELTEARKAPADRRIESFDLSIRSKKILKSLGVQTLGDVVRLSAGEIRSVATSNTTVMEISNLLSRYGMFLAPD